MLILVDHPLPGRLLVEIADSNVLYRPELATVDEHVLGCALAREKPDALLTKRVLGRAAARSWRTACPRRHLVLVVIGSNDGIPFQEPLEGVINCAVTPSGNSLVEALTAAESAWIGATIRTKLVTKTARARTGSGRSVAMVGAGVVNLLTALRLVREGHENIAIYEKSPDLRAEAHWKDYGCSRGGGDARMFTLTEADGYYFGATHGEADVFRVPIRDGGWRITGSASLSGRDLDWVSANAAVPLWLGHIYTSEILLFNRAAGELWHELMRDEPALFHDVGLRKGILRLYTDEQHLRRQIFRQQKVGADPLVLTPPQIAARHPALADAVRGQAIAGGIEVTGFTVQAHVFMTRLVDFLEQSGVRFSWGQEVSPLQRDRHGAPSGLWVGDELVSADHFVLSPGVYGGKLLRGTASDNLIHGVLGAWLTLAGTDPSLEHSLKIARRGHLAPDANVTVAIGPGGDPQLIIGAGYGWTGHNPENIDPEELAVLYDAIEDTASMFFPSAFEKARQSNLLKTGRRFCIRPWTASSLGVMELVEKSDGGIMVITGGHNTGGFAQAPVVAEAVSAALHGRYHLMHTLYHPDRLRAFLRARRSGAVTMTERALRRR